MSTIDRAAHARGHLVALLVAPLLLVGCVTSRATAAPRRRAKPVKPQRTHKIVPDDYFTIGHVFGASPSPDGRSVVYSESRWDKSLPKRNTDLWLVRDGRSTTRLTFDRAGDYAARWSRDGRFIYFRSARRRPGHKKPPYNGKPQVWRIRPDGSDLRAVTRVPRGVRSFSLTGDGRWLYYTTTKRHHDKDPFRKLRKRYKKLRYGHGVRQPTQLWRLDLSHWRAEKLYDPKRTIRAFALSPDGRAVAMITTPDRLLISNEGWSRVDVLDLTTRAVSSPPSSKWRKQAPSPFGWLGGLAWSSDSKRLSFVVAFDGYPSEIFVVGVEVSPKARAPRFTFVSKLDRRVPDSTLRPYVRSSCAWRPGSNELCWLADLRARNRIYCTSVSADGKQGRTRLLTAGPQNVESFVFASKRRVVAVMSGLTHPPDVFSFDAWATRRVYSRLTRANPQVDTWILPKLTKVRWKSKDGTEVEGVLELPPGGEAKNLPLLVKIHGGPTASDKLRFRFWIYGRTLFAARGWAVLGVNYRGSTGYGDKFLTDLIGHKNDRDVADILSGVDTLVKRGIADPKRMALMGWSNGGYLTNCIITRTTRFRAASSGAGVFDTAMQWMIEDTPGHVINFSRGLPWQRPDAMRKSSPLYAVHKVKTPTIIHVGARDPRVPAQHSRALYRALRRYLRVPTELVVYPGEPHGLRKRKHRKAKLAWDIKWLDHYVLGRSAGAKKRASTRK